MYSAYYLGRYRTRSNIATNLGFTIRAEKTTATLGATFTVYVPTLAVVD